ncbi:MAG: PQQ-binding-like beta-propeller repeat protein [Prolixibacteraceae bacterium]|nr:PQQ-binding-like beta-propeller repeat protein [Prolixibacteraceae bacterium]
MKKPTIQIILTDLIILYFIVLTPQQIQAQNTAEMYKTNWPEWRGFQNTGSTPYATAPVEFSETKNLKWKTEIPGKGHATPIIWGDQIIVLTSVPTSIKPETAKEETTQEQSGRRMPGGPKAEFIHKFVVISVDKNSGKINWQTEVTKEFPQESTHELGSWASNSPATDGEFIYAYFGSRGLFCLDFSGKILWSRDFGQMEKVMSFGEGSSPAVGKNNVYVQWDHQGQSFIYAIDKKTGKDAWVKERDEVSSWATPLVIEVNGKLQVVTAASKLVRSYDAETGEVIWEMSGLTGNVIPNPKYADGILYVMSGYRGTALKAIDLAKAKGDITGTDVVLWNYDKDTPYTPDGILMDGKLYFLRNNNGMLTCLDAKTGEVIYSNQRTEGINTLYSSPTGIGDKIYIAAENKVLVIQASKDFKILATNNLDDDFRASPIAVGKDLIIRGFQNLYCFSEE